MPSEYTQGGGREHTPHRTIDRVFRLLEEIVERPGLTLGELTRALDMPKSTTHSFIDGLLARGWLYEVPDGAQYKLFLGPAAHSLILNSGQIRAGSVSRADLNALQDAVQAEVYLGVMMNDQLFLVAEAGADPVAGFHARRTTRVDLLNYAGGKAMVAMQSDEWIEAYFRRRTVRGSPSVENFLAELPAIRQARIAVNYSQNGTRLGIAGVLRGESGRAVAAVTVVGPAVELEPRKGAIVAAINAAIGTWEKRDIHPREAI